MRGNFSNLAVGLLVISLTSCGIQKQESPVHDKTSNSKNLKDSDSRKTKSNIVNSEKEGPTTDGFSIRDGTPDHGDYSIIGIKRAEVEGQLNLCSGTAIKYNGYGDGGGCILTASHCVGDMEWVTPGPSIDSNPKFTMLNFSRRYAGPYNTPDFMLKDIAVVWVDGFDGSGQWEPREFFAGCPVDNTVYEIKGYGKTEHDYIGQPGHQGGFRHKGLARTIDNVPGQQDCCTVHPTAGEGAYFEMEREGETISCEGDSGGPVLYVGKVRGVISAGDDWCAINQKGYYTALTNGNDTWLEDQIPEICCAVMSQPCGEGIKCCNGLECNNGSCDTPF